VHSTKDLKTKADQCVQDTIVAIRILDGHRNTQNGAYLKNHSTFPLEFFDRITVQMKERLYWYKTTIEVCDSWSLHNLPHETLLPSKSNGNSPQLPHKLSVLPNVSHFVTTRKAPLMVATLFTAITSTLQSQYATFVALANKIAVIDAELQKIKGLYTQLWRARTGSMRDPFNELDRGTGKDFGLEGLSV
jgi:nucleoporin p58/p45